MITTTPRPIELVRELVARAKKDDSVIVTKGKTLDNAKNLAKSFMQEIQARYAGTRLGRQELDAEILEDVPGALWTRANLDEHRRSESDLPEMTRVVVAVDPPATSNETSDEAGIVVVAQGADGRGYVLSDESVGAASPRAWARRVCAAFDRFDADRVVAEVNQGGEMVEAVLKSERPNLSVTMVRASRGKHVRAEPVAALYEQGRVSHVGAFPEMEDQMVLMTHHGYEGEKSPDRLDALVWGFSELFPAMTRKTKATPPLRRPVGTMA
jgi:phage terminase large subunit-like protein